MFSSVLHKLLFSGKKRNSGFLCTSSKFSPVLSFAHKIRKGCFQIMIKYYVGEKYPYS